MIPITPFDAFNFSQFTETEYQKEIESAIEIARNERIAVYENVSPPTFKNLLEPLENIGKNLNRLTSVLFNLLAAHTTPALQETAQFLTPLLTALVHEQFTNTSNFDKIERVYKNEKHLLNIEQQQLLEKTYKQFIRNGALLNDIEKKRLAEIDKNLGLLALQFGQNVMNATNAFSLHITDASELDGLPQYALETAEKKAKKQNLKGYVLGLSMPETMAVLKFAHRESLRKTIYIANASKAFDSEFDNTEIIHQLVDLKRERAQLLGYDSHAHFVLEERMASTISNVHTFANQLMEVSYPKSQQELAKLQTFAQSLGKNDPIHAWDFHYYSEQEKENLFQLSDELLKPYFSIETVLEGLFWLVESLFDVRFIEDNTISVYHQDVTVYQIIDHQHQVVGLLYVDLWVRSNKRAGAWMTSFQHQSHKKNQIPHVSVVCNFNPPNESNPGLLTFDELLTLFHEFGHALHGLLSDVTYESLSGTHVLWDFVELPSQFMENFCYEPIVLNKIAKHYQTSETIPSHLINNLVKARQYMAAYQTVRQVNFVKLDMAWHSLSTPFEGSINDFENKIVKKYQLFPKETSANMSCSFSHIFQGGYAAGYYSYKWAEVLDADAFARFKSEGILNKILAHSFKEHILSKGGSQLPMELYKAFAGKEPQIIHLLKRLGMV